MVSIWVLQHYINMHLFLIIFFLMADKELSYDHLAMGLKEALQNDKSAFDADRLQKYNGMNFLLYILCLFHCST